MEKLRIRSIQKVENTSLNYIRDEMNSFDWTQRLIGIKGARGIGKTTLILQYLKITHGITSKAIYLSLDDIYFTEHSLISVVEDFHRNGGLFLYLDEVHKYPNWAIEVKNLYDTYIDLKIVFTGSSMLELHKSNADLSRRAIIFHLQGLSFRQFLDLKYQIKTPIVSLEKVFQSANDIISSFDKPFKPYVYFREYLQKGYYPFFIEDEKWFFDRLEATIKVVIETDFLLLNNIDSKNIRRIYQLLLVIATSPPFKPNIQKLIERIGINRNTLLQYIHYLEQADVFTLLQSNRKGITLLQKPEKIYLNNTNLLYAFAPHQLDIGMVRETFVLNQLKAKYPIHYPTKGGDVLVNHQYTLEIGGKSKPSKQIAQLENAFIIADDWDYKVGNKVPIWLLGLLY